MFGRLLFYLDCYGFVVAVLQILYNGVRVDPRICTHSDYCFTATSLREVGVVSESWQVSHRDTIRRRLLWLRLRYRLLLFVELALLGTTAVLFISIAVVAVGKVVYLPEPFRSLQAFLLAVGAVIFTSFLWASLRSIHDLELASFIDREVAQPGMMESAVDFLSRPDEIDPSHLQPFLQNVAKMLVSTPSNHIIGIQLPRLWRVTACALILLLVVHFFVPVTRVIREEQDPFLIRDLQRLSVEFAGAALNASRTKDLSREDRELFEKAEQLSRRMAADSIDPSYLQDELLRLTKGINEQSLRTRAAGNELVEQVLERIEKLRQDHANRSAQNSALEDAMKLLSATATQMQDSSTQQRIRGAHDMMQVLQELVETPTDVLSSEELEAIQHLISELQSELTRNQSLESLSDLSERSLSLLSRDHLEDLTSTRRDQLSEQMQEFLRSHTGVQPEDGAPGSEGMSGHDQRFGHTQSSDAAQGLLGDQGASRDSAIGLAGSEDGRPVPMGDAAVGIGTSPGDNVYGQLSEQMEGARTFIDHRLMGEGDEMDLTLSTVLGSPSEGEIGVSPSEQLEVYSGQAYEGQIIEGEYPERYKQIVSNYFDGLK